MGEAAVLVIWVTAAPAWRRLCSPSAGACTIPGNWGSGCTCLLALEEDVVGGLEERGWG